MLTQTLRKTIHSLRQTSSTTLCGTASGAAAGELFVSSFIHTLPRSPESYTYFWTRAKVAPARCTYLVIRGSKKTKHVLTSGQQCMHVCRTHHHQYQVRTGWFVLGHLLKRYMLRGCVNVKSAGNHVWKASGMEVAAAAARQCTVYPATHWRRMRVACTFVSTVLTNHITHHSRIAQRVVQLIGKLRHKAIRLPLKSCLMAGTLLFNWKDECISDQELDKAINTSIAEMEIMKRFHQDASNNNNNSTNTNQNQNSGSAGSSVDDRQPAGTPGRASQQQQPQPPHPFDDGEKWEEVIKQDDVVMWRRRLDPDSSVYEYKVFGTYRDITARSFWNVQLDLSYRKQWDKLVVKLDVIDREPHHGCEVVHWISHYPFPMDAREYVFVRRAAVDHERSAMILVSRAVTSPVPDHVLVGAGPGSSSEGRPRRCVRVTQYFSQMVITPHTDFDQAGFDYVLVYYDDPRAMIPSKAYNWASTYGYAKFADHLHRAAKSSENGSKKLHSEGVSAGGNNSSGMPSKKHQYL